VNELATTPKKPLVRLWDKDFNLVRILGDEVLDGGGSLNLPAEDPLAEWLLEKVPTEPTFVTVDDSGTRWHGRVKWVQLSKNNCGCKRTTAQIGE